MVVEVVASLCVFALRAALCALWIYAVTALCTFAAVWKQQQSMNP